MTAHDDSDSVTSADEALFELLGISKLTEREDDDQPRTWEELLKESPSDLDPSLFERDSVYQFPTTLPAEIMRQITNELVWDHNRDLDRTYETIAGVRTLTRLERFVQSHPQWSQLAQEYLPLLLEPIVGCPVVLFKEKLNLKPPGGSGFAPHLDSPSLAVAFGEGGPQTFWTVMVAIDDMTVANGCLRVVKGEWSTPVETIPPTDDNPDAGGRLGAIDLALADMMSFEPLLCKGGSIVVFGGNVPHRSSRNDSAFERRAVFLTYNPTSEGTHRDAYYRKMTEMRDGWKQKSLKHETGDWLSTVPT